MKARKCDRCHEYYDSYSPTGEVEHANGLSLIEFGDTAYIHRKSYDLCPICMIRLVTFLNNPEDRKVDK